LLAQGKRRGIPLRAADRTILPGERPPTEIYVKGHLTNLRVGAKGTGHRGPANPATCVPIGVAGASFVRRSRGPRAPGV
jgi:hypothetical protein